jgi:hypothetical protein
MDYSKLNAQELYDVVAVEHPAAWDAAAKAWGKMAVLASNAAGGVTSASGHVTIWRQSNDSDAQKDFDRRIQRDVEVLNRWSLFGQNLMLRMNRVSAVLSSAQVEMRAWAAGRADQVRIRDQAADDYSARNSASNEIARLDGLARGRMQFVAQTMNDSMSDKDPERPGRWTGPRAAPGGAPAPETRDDQTPGPGTAGGGTGAGTGAGTPDAGDDKPSTPEKPTTPEAKDPVEEAGKLIDVVGKGIDLVGKVPENLDKWLTLAQNAKDLLGADPSSAATTPDPSSALSNGLTTDAPALAGGTSTAPIYTPDPYTPPTTSGGGGLGSIGMPFSGGGGGGGHTGLPSGTTDRSASSLRSATTAGGAGAEPALIGKTATTASTSTQASTPPMYPPMGGAGAAGGAGRGEIRPGAAASKAGFTVPAESSASERMRRQGVQSDLQGRTNGEHGTPSGAPPLRKRRASARSRRTATEDVLDDELWKL